MNTNPAGRIASIHSGQKPPRSTTFLRPHQFAPARSATHPTATVTRPCQPVRTTYSQVTALLTLDNRALSELGWQHLSRPLVVVSSPAWDQSAEQAPGNRPGHPATDTYSTPAMSSRSAATWVLSARRPAAVRDI